MSEDQIIQEVVEVIEIEGITSIIIPQSVVDELLLRPGDTFIVTQGNENSLIIEPEIDRVS